LQDLEDALSDGFGYHKQLDQFLLRCNLPEHYLNQARAESLQANQRRRTPFPQPTKRDVVQALLRHLAMKGREGDSLVSDLITHIQRIELPHATENGRAALSRIRKRTERAQSERIERENEAIARRRQDDAIRAEKTSEIVRQKQALLSSFESLYAMEDKQARGFALERLLQSIFAHEGLDPRASFRNTGEQIDGSFSWQGRVFLVEAKWTEQKVGGREFSQLIYKIGGKSADTRGLFISINGFSEPALEGLNGKGTLNFVCMDGAHLMRALQPGDSFTTVFARLVRHLGDTGGAYLPTSQF
jgi:hypothetical protein